MAVKEYQRNSDNEIRPFGRPVYHNSDMRGHSYGIGVGTKQLLRLLPVVVLLAMARLRKSAELWMKTKLSNLEYLKIELAFVWRHLTIPELRNLPTVVVLGAAMCSVSAHAQSGAGAIQGTVEDSTGAAVPGAAIRVVNQGTGSSNDTKSNSVGFFSVPSLFTGTYNVTVTAKGMSTYTTVIQLQVAQNAVVNPTLTVGEVTQQVVVSGNAIQLTTTDSGTISSVLENNRINQLPMNGRQLTTLTGMTTPGLEASGSRANGNMPEGLEYVQDGAPMINRNFGGESNSAQAQLPDPDSVQEVRVETTASSAQFATPATGIITTKSGTNELHGTMFETARNNYIGVAKARQDPYNLKAPHLVRNEFGISLGGPIIVPKLYNGRGKSFFFFAYERFSLRQSASELVSVPTLAWRQGDFSNLVNSNGQLQVVYDPSTSQPASSPTPYQRTPFPNNTIPMSQISPLAKIMYAITPLPTTADNPLVSPNLTTINPITQTVPTFTFRLDHNFNEKNKVYLRFTDLLQSNEALTNNPTAPATIAGAGLPANAEGISGFQIGTFSASLGYSHVFTSTFYSETVLGNEWFNQNDTFGTSSSNHFNYEAFMGLPNNFGNLGFPDIANTVTPYPGTQTNYDGDQIITNIDENLTKILGRHQLKFGGRYRHERLGYLTDRRQDTVNFYGQGTGDVDPTSGQNYSALSNTGNGNSDLFLGQGANYSQQLNAPYGHYRDMEFDSYIQDNFHASNKLTINIGLRWEVHPGSYTKDGLQTSFDLKNKAIVLSRPTSFYVSKGYTTQTIITNLENLGAKFETPQQAGLPDNILRNYDLNFSPRLGVAYTPFGSQGTVVRAGGGRYIYPVPVRNSLRTSIATPPFQTQYNMSYLAANQSPDGLPNYILRTPQSVIAGGNSANVVNTGSANALVPGSVALTTLTPNYSPDFVTQVDVTVEQPIKEGTALRVSYVYDHGTNLDQEYEYNNPMSTYSWEKLTGTTPPTGVYASTALGPYDQTLYGNNIISNKTGWSSDHALQANYQRLYRTGYAYQIFYVYSRAFRVGGNTFRDSIVYPAGSYAPGVAPSTNYKALNRFENYGIDSAIPEHHIGFNGIVDLPVGRGKHFLGHVNRFVDELIGGYQIAGDGSIVSQYFQPSTSNWGATNPLHVYKKKYAVKDCSSGVCHSGYLWFNGYISPLVLNASKNGISGVPSSYLPYQSPINTNTTGANALTNNVPVVLANGKTVNTAYSPGPAGVNPYSHTFLHGPFDWSADLSLFKVFPITQTVNIRVNVDAFNAFNVQGDNNPNTTTGVQTFLTSHNTPRQLQFTARLTF